MSAIRPSRAVGDRNCLVTLAAEGLPVPLPDGGYTSLPVPLAPEQWYCAIDAASNADLERLQSGTATARATHVLTGPYHPGITTSTRITYNGRTFYVSGVTNAGERNAETIAFCEEQVNG